jgi:hypothetical protein
MEYKSQNNTIEDVDLGYHICSIYKNVEEQFSAVVPFIKKGLDNHQKCVYIVDENSKEDVIAELNKGGIESETYINASQLLLLTKRETYLKDGFFDPDRMIALLRETEKNALAEGFSGLRVTGEMTWVLEGVAGSDKLIEYEAKLNDFFPNSKSTAICQYNENKFKPEMLVEVIHTHPFVIIYGNLFENKYYYSPRLYTQGTRIRLPVESYVMIRDEIIEQD